MADDAEHWISTHFHYATSSFFITVFNPLTVMAFAAAFAESTGIWILKPVGMSRGRGIEIIRTIDDVRYTDACVIQRNSERGDG